MSGDHGRWIGLGVGALFGVALLAGCGGSGENLPEISRTASRTADVPSISRTAEAPTKTRTADAPTKTRTADAPTASAPATTSDAPEPSSAADSTPAASEEPTNSWWVWLLAAAVVAVGIGWFVVAKRHGKWDAAFSTELLEARWAADTLTPSVTDRSASADEITQRWGRGKRRLDELLTELSRLADTASGAGRSSQVGQVSGAAAALSQALSECVSRRVGSDPTEEAAGDLAESRGVAQARADALLDAIAAAGASSNVEAQGR